MCHVRLNKTSSKKSSKKETERSIRKNKRSIGRLLEVTGLIRELDNMGYKSAADTLEHFQYDVINHMQFPQSHWIRIRTTNMMERTNKEIKKKKQGSRGIPEPGMSIETTSLNTH